MVVSGNFVMDDIVVRSNNSQLCIHQTEPAKSLKICNALVDR